MSTDWGLKCVTCQCGFIPDNGIPEYVIEDVLLHVDGLARLARCLEQVGKIDVEVSAYWVSAWTLRDLLEWCVTHRRHHIVICNEYGDIYSAEQFKEHRLQQEKNAEKARQRRGQEEEERQEFQAAKSRWVKAFLTYIVSRGMR